MNNQETYGWMMRYFPGVDLNTAISTNSHDYVMIILSTILYIVVMDDSLQS